jgi:hypothetical protein
MTQIFFVRKIRLHRQREREGTLILIIFLAYFTLLDVNKAWETIRENIKISAKESPVIMN